MTPEQKVEWARRVKNACVAMQELNEYVEVMTQGRTPDTEEADAIAMFQDTEEELHEILIWAEELTND